MTGTGHDERTRAVVEQMRRKSTTITHNNQHLPTEIVDCLQAMADQQNAMAVRVQQLELALSELTTIRDAMRQWAAETQAKGAA